MRLQLQFQSYNLACFSTRAFDMASFETYTVNHLECFYQHVNLPEKHWHTSVEQLSTPEAQLEFLSVLQKYTLVYVPFENLSLHYSTTKVIDLFPDVLFKKMVPEADGQGEQSHRGGYCMEVNALFGAILRTLGFTVRSVGAKVFTGSGWTGW